MNDFDFEEMQKIQIELQEKYKDKWTPNTPKLGRDKLLWLMIEAGEMADVIKKDGDKKIMKDSNVRRHFIEEMCDTLMYFNDIMLCYDITIDELKNVYFEKHKKNMSRW